MLRRHDTLIWSSIAFIVTQILLTTCVMVILHSSSLTLTSILLIRYMKLSCRQGFFVLRLTPHIIYIKTRVCVCRFANWLQIFNLGNITRENLKKLIQIFLLLFSNFNFKSNIGIENSSEPAERSKHSFMENPKEVYFIIGGCTTMQLLNKKRTITFCANSHMFTQ